MAVRTWISALRLRTLPLAVSGILTGTFIAGSYATASWPVLIWALITAVLLQILSNLSNDYGDFTKGTDNEFRLGNTRALQSGNITPAQMRIAIWCCALLAFISGLLLLYFSFNGQFNFAFLLFLLIGLLAIAAAVKYTIGRNPYGYRGIGDIMVFLFFGPVAVAGTYYLHTGFSFDSVADLQLIAPVCFIGALCTAVLNTNNIRDIENDRNSGKITIPVRLGLSRARIYHSLLIGIALVSAVVCVSNGSLHKTTWLSLAGFFPILLQWKSVMRMEPSPLYNKLLKQLSIGTLLFVLLLIITEVAGELWNTYQIFR